MEKLEPSYIYGWWEPNGSAFVENILAIPQKVKHRYHRIQNSTARYTPQRPENRYSNQHMYRYVHSSTTHSAQKAETAHVKRQIECGVSIIQP